MAPSPLPTAAPFSPTLHIHASAVVEKRDTCALDCLGGTDPGACTALDATCLCADEVWGGAVLSCIQARCSTPDALDLAYSNLGLYCASVDVAFTQLSPSFTNTLGAASVSSVAATATVSVGLTTATVGTTAPPPAAAVGKAVNVSAIMASICSLLLAISFVIGFFAIKARILRSRDDQTRSKNNNWGGATAMTDRSGTNTTNNDSKSHSQSQSRPQIPVNPLRKGPVNQLSSSMFGGTTTMGSSMSMDGGAGGDSYADQEREAREERIDAARLKRSEAAATLRAENLHSLFSSSPSNPNPLDSTTHLTSPEYNSKSTTSLVSASSSYKQRTHSLGSDDEGEGEDGSQFVVMPSLSEGGHDGQMTGSTMDDGIGGGERVWQAESTTGLGGLGGMGTEGGRSRLDLEEER